MWHQLPLEFYSIPELEPNQFTVTSISACPSQFPVSWDADAGRRRVLAGSRMIEAKRIDFATGWLLRVVTPGTAKGWRGPYYRDNNSGRRRKKATGGRKPG
jgi:hypothetical protein